MSVFGEGFKKNPKWDRVTDTNPVDKQEYGMSNEKNKALNEMNTITYVFAYIFNRFKELFLGGAE